MTNHVYKELKLADKGIRFDAGKPRMDLLPPDALYEIAKVFSHGAEKYADRNWEKGMAWGKVIGSLLRHTTKLMAGEDRDDESGELHAAHIAVNAMFLIAYHLRGIGDDDRLHCGLYTKPEIQTEN